MDIILNSIMLFSLISTPLDTFESKAYKLYTSNTKIQRRKNQKIQSEDINNLMIEIDNNFNIISNLLQEKNTLSQNIKQKFNDKIKSKEKLSKQQMTCYQEYTSIVCEEEKNISIYNNKIHNKKDMINLENEMLSNKNNFGIIYKKLTSILNNQIKVIANLYRAIFHLRLSLEVI